MAGPPIRSVDELESATPARLGEQIRWELRRILDDGDLTQERLALDLGYQSQAQVSKWTHGHASISLRAAQELDRIFGDTTLGISFVDLRKRFRQSLRSGRVIASPAGSDLYDVFLASPMASAASRKAYQAERSSALDLSQALETWCKFKVYYAGSQISTEDDFDAPEIGVEINFNALRNSRYFVLLATEVPRKPSSIFVEAGYALAMNTPSLYLVTEPAVLPYALQQLNQAGGALPPVLIEYVQSVDRATSLLKKQGVALFERLASLSDRS